MILWVIIHVIVSFLYLKFQKENYDDFNQLIEIFCDYCESESFREINIGFKIINSIIEEEPEKYFNNKELIKIIESTLIEIIDKQNIFSVLKSVKLCEVL